MNSRSKLSLLAAGAAALILLAACARVSDVNVELIIPPLTIAAKDCGLGGPYLFRAERSKVTNFKSYQDSNLSFSEGVLLTSSLLQVSVNSDQDNTAGIHSSSKYNYIVSTDDCEIYVATWTISTVGEGNANDLDDVKERLKTYDCGAINDLNAVQTFMINFWTEDLKGEEKWSPCWLDDNGEKEDGILDTTNKHFILAQGPGKKTIGRMLLGHNEDDPAAHRSIAYGGEIVVDVSECTYTINNGSGTYAPLDHHSDLPDDEGPSYLMAMARQLKDELGIAPAFVQSFENNRITETNLENQEIPGCHR